MPSPDEPTPSDIASTLRAAWPTKTPFSERWGVLEQAWGTADPTEVVPRYAAEQTLVGRDGGLVWADIARLIGGFVESPEIDQICSEVGELHGVAYSPEVVRDLIRVEVADAYNNAPPIVQDEAFRFRHNVFSWMTLALIYNVTEAELP